MLELLRILLPTLAVTLDERHDLVVENLLLRHQLQVALRSRPRRLWGSQIHRLADYCE
jgi:hypothetical protein